MNRKKSIKDKPFQYPPEMIEAIKRLPKDYKITALTSNITSKYSNITTKKDKK